MRSTVSKSVEDTPEVNDVPRDPPFVFVPPELRHSIPRRISAGEATPEEVIHHLLGAYASETLAGALAEAQVFAEMIADRLSSDRHFGTLANHLAARLEVCVVMAEDRGDK
jgi:hypothetical protein